jgi:catechol-2,3-dioxygenase
MIRKEHAMLSNFTPSATVAVKSLASVRSFYEGILGFEPIESAMRGAQAFKVQGATVVIYESQFAGTNQATAITWGLGEHFDDMVRSLDAKGVAFEHYEFPGIVREGHVHVARDGKPSRVAWFKDPDGNLHNLNNGS